MSSEGNEIIAEESLSNAENLLTILSGKLQ